MTERRIIRQLARQPREQIEAELVAVRTERSRLDIEEALLTQVLRLKDASETAPESAPGEEQADTSRQATSQPSGASVIGSVESVVNQANGDWLGYGDVHERLAELGMRTSRENVRVALRRLAERGRVQRHDGGKLYRKRLDVASFDSADRTGSSDTESEP